MQASEVPALFAPPQGPPPGAGVSCDLHLLPLSVQQRATLIDKFAGSRLAERGWDAARYRNGLAQLPGFCGLCEEPLALSLLLRVLPLIQVRVRVPLSRRGVESQSSTHARRIPDVFIRAGWASSALRRLKLPSPRCAAPSSTRSSPTCGSRPRRRDSPRRAR
jgi:hypothetical protein